MGLSCPPRRATSYAAIALDKARTAHAATGVAAIGDDSGIEVAGLGGRPGIHSARYGGLGATDEENLEKLLREVGGGRRRSPRRLPLRPGAGRSGRIRARLRGPLRGVPDRGSPR